MESIVPASPARSRVDWMPHLHQAGLLVEWDQDSVEESKVNPWLESSPLSVVAGFLFPLKPQGTWLKGERIYSGPWFQRFQSVASSPLLLAQDTAEYHGSGNLWHRRLLAHGSQEAMKERERGRGPVPFNT